MEAVCAVGVLVGVVAWIVCWRMVLIICCFLLPNVCGGCVCSRGSSGTGGVDCVLEDVSKTTLLSVAFVCGSCVCSGDSSGTSGSGIACWRMFLILCCFLLPNVCGGCVCSRGSSGTGGVDCLLEDVSNTTLLSVAFVCGGCVCSGDSSGTSGVDCVLEDVSNSMLFSLAYCVLRLCVHWGF